MIIGDWKMIKIGIINKFKHNDREWDGTIVPMKQPSIRLVIYTIYKQYTR